MINKLFSISIGDCIELELIPARYIFIALGSTELMLEWGNHQLLSNKDKKELNN